ncbi:hypothetical protein CDD82_6510 [Ophiocordyceps australis]|uniref:DNA (cytosine-5-)-methyltransferase n=1 Tax=Ophiocordyceps australis TaxID=1399860 RepID=A0A2C5ZSD5_9HYPO|nr:hypothetical protein CDD82_6510 [Ophiocordyceps australis]
MASIQCSIEHDDGEGSNSEEPEADAPNSCRLELASAAGHLTSPRCYYESFDSPVPIMSEKDALAMLHVGTQDSLGKDYIAYDLDDFSIYYDKKGSHPCEIMRPLSHIGTKAPESYVDGILSSNNGEHKFFVKRIHIKAMPVDNYGIAHHTVRGAIWVQSWLNRDSDTYYRLGRPAREYQRFYEPSLWLADLAKHFVDYCDEMHSLGHSISIHHFRYKFFAWLESTHQKAPAFLDWTRQHPSTDFMTSVIADAAYLYKESIGVLHQEGTLFHSIWSEIWTFERYKAQPIAGTKTVVTQYMHDCFAHMPFGDKLEVVAPSDLTRKLWYQNIKARRLELPSPLDDWCKSFPTVSNLCIKSIKPGDTISTHRDCETTGAMWKRQTSKWCADVDRWFALVQKVEMREEKRVFDVIWYYRPLDTLCGLMRYPWNNELFLSDHCSCTEEYKIREDQVQGIHEVDFGGNSTTKAEFFCRQTYFHSERKWVTLEADDVRCEHSRQARRLYRPGDTVLVRLDTKSGVAEPCEVTTCGDIKTWQFRRLLRRGQIQGQTKIKRPPNEVVYSNMLVEKSHNAIIGRCHVRFFHMKTPVPTPYDRDGVGAFFYFSHIYMLNAEGIGMCVPLEACPESLHQGLDPMAAGHGKLRGLDLFCGGGNFGRGLEEGGGIEMCWANDYDSKAVHTYMANTTSPITPFLGSVDDLQRQALRGNFCQMVPRVGQVDFICGGSPCPGFSTLTNDKTTAKQRKNQSLVAAFASFIDLYRPKYALLENVTGIVHGKKDRDQDVFSQLICAVVGLGYQTHFFFVDASSCGSAQRRPRIFIAIAAPGYRLPERPVATHSYPAGTMRRSIGLLPTGEPMTERLVPTATPFKFVSASEATADLPEIGDGRVDICPGFADHRVSLGVTRLMKSRIALIPKQPWGMNLAKAWYGQGPKRVAKTGSMTEAEYAQFCKHKSMRPGRHLATSQVSNAWGRMYPHRLFETIVTDSGPGDGKNGRILHWRDDRPVTIMEARRAQGIRDNEVLLGNLRDQYKIVGNSVAREVALALGSVLREAWASSLEEGVVDDGQGGGVGMATQDQEQAAFDDGSASYGDKEDHSSRECSTPATGLSWTSSQAKGFKRPWGLEVQLMSGKKRKK